MRILRKKLMAIILLTVMAASLLTGCGSDKGKADETVVRVGSMKGPTSMGLLFLMDKASKGEAQGNYDFQMKTAADELVPLLVKGELDIALVPANVASVLYHKTNGGIRVIDINTLGVLYLVSGAEETQAGSISDLKDKTVYLTGKGTTPDYVLQYLLKENGLEPADCTLEYKSEPAEVVSVLAENPDAIGLLPQPFVTVACMQNDKLSPVLDLNEEWNKVQEQSASEKKSSLVTGVTVVRGDFLTEHEDAVLTFLKEQEESALAINADVEKGAALAVEAGIVPKEPVAKKAIPGCSITYLDGEEMKQALAGYLEVLYEQNPEAVGGEVPEEEFYFCK